MLSTDHPGAPQCSREVGHGGQCEGPASHRSRLSFPKFSSEAPLESEKFQ